LSVHIPHVICMDCKMEMRLIEGTNRRICGYCDQEVEIKVIDQ